jgi:hypothetical protein
MKNLVSGPNYSFHLLQDDTPRISPVIILELVPDLAARLGDERRHTIQLSSEDELVMLDDAVDELQPGHETECSFTGKTWQLAKDFGSPHGVRLNCNSLPVEIADAEKFLNDLTEAKQKAYEIFDGPEVDLN